MSIDPDLLKVTIRAVDTISEHILEERVLQLKKWGPQSHPDGTGARVAYAGFLGFMEQHADSAKKRTDYAARKGILTWRDILLEEIFEAMAESDPEALRAELVQSSAVIAAWIQDIDTRATVGG